MKIEARTDAVRVTAEDRNGSLIVKVFGFLDAHTYEVVSDAIDRALEHVNPTKVVVDLTKVTSITSAGIGVFVGLEAEGFEVSIAANGNVRETIALLTPQFLTITPRERQLLAA